MYWPLGAPKVYLARRHWCPDDVPASDAGAGATISEQDCILALQSARVGHLLATITGSFLDLWNTSVRLVADI